MKYANTKLSVRTHEKQQMVDLTNLFTKTVQASGVRDGFAGIYSQHTTAAVFVGEFQRALIEDMLDFLKRVVRDDLAYKHNSPEFSDCERRNAASHLRGVLLNHGVLLPVVDGVPVLGQFQSVVLAELDGPRDRMLHVHVLGQ
jgi:secondary thiamine-phosphate synthase enzyme